jgi:hypothetical protein
MLFAKLALEWFVTRVHLFPPFAYQVERDCAARANEYVPVGADTPFACCQIRSVHFARNRSKNTHNDSSPSRHALP